MSSPLTSARSALVARPCSELFSAPVSWLWEAYLGRGKLAFLDGEADVGKSLLAIDLAARVSRGLPMPGSTVPTEPGTVLVLSAKDAAGDTILPRLLAAGGDPARVHVGWAHDLRLSRLPQFPDDFHRLNELIDEVKAALVIIDPMLAFLAPGIRAGDDRSIREALTALAGVAAWTGACQLLVGYPRKGGGVGGLYRGTGSVAMMGAARTGLMITRHPDDPELRVLTLCKTNIGPPAASLGFRLARGEGTGHSHLEWTGVVDLSSDELLGVSVPLRTGTLARERACEWLEQFLAGGPRRASEVVAEAQKAGIPERTLRRVKSVAGVMSEARNCDGTIEWWWSDPAVEDADEVYRDGSELADFDPLPELELLHG